MSRQSAPRLLDAIYLGLRTFRSLVDDRVSIIGALSSKFFFVVSSKTHCEYVMNPEQDRFLKIMFLL